MTADEVRAFLGEVRLAVAHLEYGGTIERSRLARALALASDKMECDFELPLAKGIPADAVRRFSEQVRFIANDMKRVSAQAIHYSHVAHQHIGKHQADLLSQACDMIDQKKE